MTWSQFLIRYIAIVAFGVIGLGLVVMFDSTQASSRSSALFSDSSTSDTGRVRCEVMCSCVWLGENDGIGEGNGQ